MPRYGQSSFINGRWIREREPIPEWFKEPKPQLAQPPSAPKLGLLTHTVVKSPVSHWIIPINSEKREYSDIAFIGDYFIRIKRLGTTGKLSTLWEYHTFRTRICSAAALSAQRRLVLVLEDGDLLFLSDFDEIAKGVAPALTPCSQSVSSHPSEILSSQIAADPTSSYVALACFQNSIEVVDVRNQHRLDIHYAHLGISGIIIKMDFLYPPEKDPNLVLLAGVVARRGEFWIHLFQWDASKEPWKITKHHSEKGFQLPIRRAPPQLLIPLAEAGPAAFLVVYESHMLLCEGLLGDDFTTLCAPLPCPRPASSHTSSYLPLWVGWYKSPASGTPFYVLVREDGFTVRLGIEGNIVRASSDVTVAGTVANVAAVGLQDPAQGGAELVYLLYGAEAGPGRVVLVNGRDGTPNIVDAYAALTMPNWTPLNDSQVMPATSQISPYTGLPITTPGKIYGCSGLGTEASVLQLSRKVEVFVHSTLKQDISSSMNGMWAIYDVEHRMRCSNQCRMCLPGILISFPTFSILLRECAVEGVLENVSQEDTWLDLSSKTLSVSFFRDVSSQLTTKEIVVSRANCSDGASDIKQSQFRGAPYGRRGETVLEAASCGLFLCVYYVSSDEVRTVDVLSMCDSLKGTVSHPKCVHRVFLPDDSHPASLAIATIGVKVFFAIGCKATLQSPEGALEGKRNHTGALYTGIVGQSQRELLNMKGLEARDCTSIRFLTNDNDPLCCLVLAGYSDGVLAGWCCTVTPTHLQQIPELSFHKRLGVSEVQICVDSSNPTTALVSCGRDVYRLPLTRTSKLPQLTKVDVTLPKNTNPSVVPPRTLISPFGNDFLLATSTQILHVELGSETTGFFSLHPENPPPFPCTLLPGPATKLLASPELGSLLVAGTHLDKNGLVAGPAVISYKTDGSSIAGLFGFASQNPASKLRVAPEEITCLLEFSNPQSSPNKQPMVLCGTSRGALALALGKSGLRRALDEQEHGEERILAHEKFDGPVHALLQSPLDAGHVYACIGSTLVLLSFKPSIVGRRWEVKTETTMKLLSRGMALGWVEGDEHKYHHLMVLTARHSVIAFTVHRNGCAAEEGRFEKATRVVDGEVRNGLDMQSFPCPEHGGEVVLVSDRECGVTALWWNGKQQALRTTIEFEKVFEAELLVSIRRFAVVEVGGMWDSEAPDGAGNGLVEIQHNESPGLRSAVLGIASNGAVIQFTVVRQELWMLMAVLQHFARQVPRMCPISAAGMRSESERREEERDREFYFRDLEMGDKRRMHVDGDLVQAWLRRRNLGEWLVEKQMETPRKLSMKILIFIKALETLRPEWVAENGMGGEMAVEMANKGWSAENTKGLEGLVERVYDVLEYLFRPVV